MLLLSFDDRKTEIYEVVNYFEKHFIRKEKEKGNDILEKVLWPKFISVEVKVIFLSDFWEKILNFEDIFKFLNFGSFFELTHCNYIEKWKKTTWKS